MSSVVDKFQTVDKFTRLSMRAMKQSPLLLSLTTLYISKESFQEDYLSAYEISEALAELGYDVSRDQIARALTRATGKVKVIEPEGVAKYKIMNPGEEVVESRVPLNHSQLIYIDAGKPFSGRRKLESLVSNVVGDVRICDPYYGKDSLSALAMTPQTSSVKFLTSRTNENKTILAAEIAAFKTQYPHVELRETVPPNEIHDRYIIDDSGLSIIGHGIKDIGKKESFIIRLDNLVAQDVIKSLTQEFMTRWNVATLL